MTLLRLINLGVRFLLELSALAVVAYWGFTVRGSFAWRIMLTVAAPLAVALFWGLFVAPKARFQTGLHGQVALGLVVFLLAAVALAQREHPSTALAFALTSTVSSLLLYLPTR